MFEGKSKAIAAGVKCSNESQQSGNFMNGKLNKIQVKKEAKARFRERERERETWTSVSHRILSFSERRKKNPKGTHRGKIENWPGKGGGEEKTTLGHRREANKH